MPDFSESTRASVRSYAAVAMLALVVGALAAPYAYTVAQPSPDGTVAVITVSGAISSSSADAIVADLREARQDGDIQAVVLRTNSPGGTVAASESLYMAVKRTSDEMPVVASVSGVAASGAYYTVAPADTILATPGSRVGSVGVRARTIDFGTVPGQVTSGPDKLRGLTPVEVRRQVEALKRSFVSAVVTERENLTLSRERLSYAKIYTGARAVELGMVDEVGGIDAAIEEAARRADLDTYDVRRFERPTPSVAALLGQGEGGVGYRGVDTTLYLALYGKLDVEETQVSVDSVRNASDPGTPAERDAGHVEVPA